MPSYILAHDLGTSGNKATIFDENGKLVASYTHSYPTHFFNSNWAEQDPDHWWDAVKDSTREVCRQVDSHDIAAVTFSGQMTGCLCVDRDGNALRPHLLYCDQRSETETERLSEELGAKTIYDITGHRVSPSYTIEKLMWIKTHEPDIYRKTYKVLQAKDYMIYRLTGVFMTERNDASGTNAMDLKRNIWSEDIIEAAGIDASLLPDIYKSTDVVGHITKEAAKLTGLAEGTPVVAGAGDGGCATIGAGSVRPGITYTNIGSSAWSSMTTTSPLIDPEMKVFTFAHPIPGYYHPTGTTQAAGSSFKWYVDELMKRFASSDTDVIYDELERQAADLPVGSNGLLFLPYLMGERTPWWDPHAKGVLLGLGLDTNASEIAHAIHEGVAMTLNYTYEIFEQNGLKSNRCRIAGGGARMKNLIRLLATVTGLPLEISEYLEESTSMGAAVIGGVGCGLYGSFDIIERMNPTVATVEPDMDRHPDYKRLQRIFEKAYLQNRELFREMQSIN